ncbi:hypothetical protein BDZ90DRAFT_88596 [Jaminaea rosea]|uniref:Uncharacterized protein n=1 Tax=Jaminaea rosea TaxID=1569628 RepID=A0A316UJ09_9BASI|nr:hypothetical protein BDZ90DRAFT_88596 [Jaminaea rosea]PWN24914.1 hypothetical protein BDZ90DRAFT_88596 [Jaminaea rosea]
MMATADVTTRHWSSRRYESRPHHRGMTLNRDLASLSLLSASRSRSIPRERSTTKDRKENKAESAGLWLWMHVMRASRPRASFAMRGAATPPASSRDRRGQAQARPQGKACSSPLPPPPPCVRAPATAILDRQMRAEGLGWFGCRHPCQEA